MLARESCEEKILRACLEAEYRLKARIDRIRWDHDVLYPQLETWKKNAKMPEIPEGIGISVEYIPPAVQKKVKAVRRKANATTIGS